MKYRLNPDGTFMSAEQIADDVVMQLRATKAASEFAGSDSDGPDGIELIRRDFDVGETPFSAFAKSEFLRSIRNTYGTVGCRQSARDSKSAPQLGQRD